MIYTFLHSLDLIAGPNSETDGVSTDEMLQVDIVLVQYSVLKNINSCFCYIMT